MTEQPVTDTMRWIMDALSPFLYSEWDDGATCTEAALAVHAALTDHGVLGPPRPGGNHD